MKPTLITLHSTKGGTGKTTTAVNLACLLSEIDKTLLIDLNVDNPNHQELFKGPEPRYNWFSYFNVSELLDRHEYVQCVLSDDLASDEIDKAKKNEFLDVMTHKEFEDKISNAIIPASKISLFFDSPCEKNLSLLYSDYYGKWKEHAQRLLTSFLIEPSVCARFFKVISTAVRLSDSKFVIVDTDAGGQKERGDYPLEWQLHWYTEGYNIDSARKESEGSIKASYSNEGKRAYPTLMDALERDKIFKASKSVVVVNSSMPELKSLKRNDRLFEVYGKNASRALVLNTISESAKEQFRATIGDYNYNPVIFLPQLLNVGFGNLGGSDNRPTIYYTTEQNMKYRKNLELLADNIISKTNLSR